MIKKIILIFIIFLSSPAFALDRKELNVEFFNRFNDDCLYRYINQALENNHTAKQATHRVEQYRQRVKYSFGKELPSLNVSAKYLGIKVPLLDNFMLDQNAFVLPFSVNYEPDFLLKNRDKTKSEKKAYEASKYDEKAIYITLLTDVATVYTNLLQYDSLIKIAQERIDANSKLLVADERKYERGILTTSDLNETLDDLEEAKNDIENYKKQQQTLLLQLGTLIGCMDIENFSRGTLDEIEYQKTIPDEISSDVIFSRPDVKMAEANLQKAKIDVRIARKEFLPSFNITGLWAFNTIAPGTFFSWQSSLAALLAGATQDIFMGGQKIATLKKQKAKYEELFEKYRQTDLDAVKEVNTALCAVKYDTKVDENTLRRLAYQFKIKSDAEKKVRRGTFSYPEYLDAQISYLLSQEKAAMSKNQRLVNYFSLYKAVGGDL